MKERTQTASISIETALREFVKIRQADPAAAAAILAFMRGLRDG